MVSLFVFVHKIGEELNKRWRRHGRKINQSHYSILCGSFFSVWKHLFIYVLSVLGSWKKKDLKNEFVRYKKKSVHALCVNISTLLNRNEF